MTNRADWLKERNKGLGASECASVLDISPWSNPLKLWQLKRGLRQDEDLSDSAAVQYGNDAEDLLRKLFVLDYPQYKMTYEPFKIIWSRETPFMFCSPDGELEEIKTGRKGGYEGKTCTIMRKGQMAEWDNCIPEHYYSQVIHAMYAAEWEFVVLKAQLKIPGAHRIITNHYFIERDDCQSDIDYIVNEETKFWESVQNGVEPPLKIKL